MERFIWLFVLLSSPFTEREPTITGKATWYATSGPGLYAAAGPALRRFLGPDWRNATVQVCYKSNCVNVTIDDFCQCYKDTADERAIDLSRDAFKKLAPTSRGKITVTVKNTTYEVLPVEEIPAKYVPAGRPPNPITTVLLGGSAVFLPGANHRTVAKYRPHSRNGRARFGDKKLHQRTGTRNNVKGIFLWLETVEPNVRTGEFYDRQVERF